MEKMNFKTTIKCSGCVAAVTPFLNEAIGEGKWTVDTNDPQKRLTVQAPVSEAEVVDAVNKAGYKAEPLSKVS